jgi:hypothetical protein
MILTIDRVEDFATFLEYHFICFCPVCTHLRREHRIVTLRLRRTPNQGKNYPAAAVAYMLPTCATHTPNHVIIWPISLASFTRVLDPTCRLPLSRWILFAHLAGLQHELYWCGPSIRRPSSPKANTVQH